MTDIAKEQTDVVFQRVGLLAFLYYPQVHVDEPGYSLTEDIAFCLEPLLDLNSDQTNEFRHLIGKTIIDPSEYRESLFHALTELTAGSSPAP